MWTTPASATIVTAAELLLARITGQPLTGVEIGLTALTWLALDVAARRLGAAPGVAPLAAIVALMPVYRAGGPADADALAWLTAAAVAIVAIVARGRAAQLAVLALAVALTAAAGPAALTGAHLLVVAAWCALATLRAPIALALAAIVAVLPGSVRWTATGPAEGPDVVLIVVDTLRGDAGRDTAIYRQLAREGRSFSRPMAAAPWTLPSMASVHTGLPVGAHGAVATPDGFTAVAAPTVAQRLADAGYDTAAVVANNPWVGRAWGFARGFAAWDHAGELAPAALPANPAVPGAHPIPVLVAETVRGVLGRPSLVPVDADAIVDRALAIAGARRDRPLFLWVHLLDPHLPYGDLGVDVDALRRDPVWRTPEGLARVRAAYDAEVARVDEALVRLLDGLGPPPERGRVVILTSDHGEEMLEHGGFEHGHTLYQELLDVPLVIAGEGVEPGVEASVVGLADVGATVLATAGLGEGPDLRRPVDDRPIPSGNLLTGRPGEGWAVRLGDRKRVDAPDGEVLYDLAADPRELRPLDGDDLRGYAPIVRHGEPADLDHDARRALEALGYLSGR